MNIETEFLAMGITRARQMTEKLGYPNGIRLTPHDASVIGDPVGNEHRERRKIRCWKKLAKLLQDTVKTCQYLTKFSKKCIFSPIMGNLEFCVFLYGKVVVPLQWISRETDEICGL